MQISTLSHPDIILPEGVSLVLPQQTHTAHVDICTSVDQTFADTDALITRDPTIAWAFAQPTASPYFSMPPTYVPLRPFMPDGAAPSAASEATPCNA